MACDQHVGRPPGRRPAHSGHGNGDYPAPVFTFDHGNGDRLVFPDLFQAIDQVANLHRHGRDDADVGWNRGRRPATFVVLGVLPIVFLAEIGIAVAFGVLLDTILVRSILVPALSHELGKVIWWPSKLARGAD